MLVDRHLHYATRTAGWVDLASGMAKSGSDVLLLEIRIAIQDLGVRSSSTEEFQNVLYPNTHSPDTRTATALPRLHGDSLQQVGRHERTSQFSLTANPVWHVSAFRESQDREEGSGACRRGSSLHNVEAPHDEILGTQASDQFVGRRSSTVKVE